MATAFPGTFGQYFVMLLITAIAAVFILLPPFSFLAKGWGIKRKQIMNDFDVKSISFYFKNNWINQETSKRGKKPNVLLSSLDPKDPQDIIVLKDELSRLYNTYYGRGMYVSPLILLVLITSISVFFSVRSALYYSQKLLSSSPTLLPPPHILLDYATISGIGGAFLWIASDGIARMRVNDYLPSDVYGHVLRMMVAIPLGLAFASLSPAIGPFLAFSVGTFPIEMISRYIRAGAAKAIGATNDADTDGDEIKRLIGINNDVAHRLMTESVATILALAKCDPIRVMMRTNLDFEVVLDLMDQAIVAAEFSTSVQANSNLLIDALRTSGLARGSQIYRTCIEVDKNLPSSVALVVALPSILDLQGDQIANCFKNIRNDDKTLLVCALRAK